MGFLSKNLFFLSNEKFTLLGSFMENFFNDVNHIISLIKIFLRG
jgi:hypothetical protein